MTDSVYLVTGATGTLGREIIADLAGKGVRVRALVRNRQKAQDLGLQGELVIGDLSKPGTLAAAFAGARAAVVLANGDDLESLEANAMRAAADAHVEHVVKVSGRHLDAEFMQGSSFALAHTAGEQRLKRIGTRWTIVRPALFASNFALWLDRVQNAFLLPAGDGWDTPTDPRDIAAVVAHVLTTTGHDGATYEVTGPERLTYREAITRLATATGRDLKLVDVDREDMRAGLVGKGVPRAQAETLIAYFYGVRTGALYGPTQTVEALLARPARRFDDWLSDHLSTFA